jgi:uncharacterized lipoprotein YbaY
MTPVAACWIVVTQQDRGVSKAVKQMVARMISGAVWLFVAGLSITGITYAEDAGVNDMKMIEGSVWYRERMALPPNA